jgi:hypothetical protein
MGVEPRLGADEDDWTPKRLLMTDGSTEIG